MTRRNYTAGMVFLMWMLWSISVWATVQVVASTPGLGALAQVVGGRYVQVTSLAPPTQDPHFVDSRPSYIVHLNRADLLIYVGGSLEVGWLPPLVTNARNGRIQPGQPGHLDASSVCGKMLMVRASVDRRMGDVHPGGNPHYLYDPHYALRVAQAISQRLSSLDGQHAAQYKANFKRFQTRLLGRIATWEKRMKPFQGRTIVGYHQSLVYLTTWLQLKRGGFVEPVPGIRPNPRHLARLILHMRRHKIQVVVSEPWFNAQVSRVVARRTHSALVRLPGDVGVSGISTYEAFVEKIISSLEKAFQTTPQGQ